MAITGCGQNEKSESPISAKSVDLDPTGSWTEGDKNSVYNRLTVNSYGTFSFETVDFSGDVKGGYSGKWHMEGNSVRFYWGSGGADSGSCSGRRTGSDGFVFGNTTFYSGTHKQNTNLQVPPSDYPIDPTFADLLEHDQGQKILIDLLSQHNWIGTSNSGKILLFSCGEPYVSENNGWNCFERLEISEATGKSIFDPIPANLKPFRQSSGHLMQGSELQEYYRPTLQIIEGMLVDYHFHFVQFSFTDENPSSVSSSNDIRGRFVSSNLMIIKFPDQKLGRVLFFKK